VGDVITEINGSSIRNEQDYSDAIDRAGRFSRMKVIRVRTGQTENMDVILNE
jgi:S1-C subfamily serine protease